MSAFHCVASHSSASSVWGINHAARISSHPATSATYAKAKPMRQGAVFNKATLSLRGK